MYVCSKSYCKLIGVKIIIVQWYLGNIYSALAFQLELSYQKSRDRLIMHARSNKNHHAVALELKFYFSQAKLELFSREIWIEFILRTNSS